VAFALVALAADWPWGDFQGHSHWHNVRWIPFVSPPVTLLDMFQNVLLFAPFGFFAALGHRRPARRVVGRVALMATGIALLGEGSQIYSHGRIPSATDLACNVLGAVLAAGLALSPFVQDIIAS
jgi:VanZ family protein